MFGTVSICISSRNDLHVLDLVLFLDAVLIVISLQDVQNLSGLGVISTSSQRFSCLIVANAPRLLCSLLWITSSGTFFFFVSKVSNFS